MLSLIQGSGLEALWGPIRLFFSHLFLLGLAASLAAALVLAFLPRFFSILPKDRGKALVADGKSSAGKPTGAGFAVFLLALPALLLALPMGSSGDVCFFSSPQWQIVGCLALAMATGFLDDRSPREWSRLRKGSLDLVVAVLAAIALSHCETVEMWLPVTKKTFWIPWPAYVAIATPVLWFTINATNCSDGVDGLAGSLTLISLAGLGLILYVVVGHETVSEYLLLPHNPDGAKWAILCLAFCGATAGYLWYNAYPSQVLMGDAGSRTLGLMVGVAALAAGNPFLVVVIAPVVLLNGGTGLVKIVLLKTLARCGFNAGGSLHSGGGTARPCWLARKLRSVRFPLHDQVKTELHWSNPQVLMRFTLVQAGLMPLLLLLLVKIR